MNILLISELVNKNGSRIGGDYKIDQINSMTTTPATPPVTTDDFMKATKQGKTLYMYRSFYTEDDESGDNVELPPKDKPVKTKKESKKKSKIEKERKRKEHQQAMIDANRTPSHKRSYAKADKLKSESKNKMTPLIEDVFTKKDFDREFVKKGVNHLVTSNIPDLEGLRETNPILIRKVSALKDIVEKNNSTGEEIAIILNFLLSMDLKDIPSEYKNLLKNKLN